MHPLLVLLATLPAQAQGRVWIVDQDLASGAHFADIQPAVAAASPGDTILVRDGEYSAVVIDGKALQLVGEASGQPEDRLVTALTIRNLAANEEVVVQGLKVYDSSTSNGDPLLVEDCVGEVLLQDVVSYADPGAYIDSCANVTISRCQFRGMNGEVVPTQASAGLVAVSSTVHTYDSTFHGGGGIVVFGCETYPKHGGPGAGLYGFGTVLVTSGSQFIGGTGGISSAFCPAGSPACHAAHGGPGLYTFGMYTFSPVKIWSLDSQYLGGPGGKTACGDPVGPEGPPMDLTLATFNTFSGTARGMVADRLVGPGESLDVHLSGEPGDQVFLVYQIGQAPLFLPTLSGTLIPQWPAPIAFAGTLPGSGELDLAIPFAGLPPGLDSVPLVVQGNFVEPTVTGYLGTPLGILLRSCATTFGEPDCNANGRADDCDISAGLSPDLNENWIPDECETVLTWRVDDDAPADPGPGNPLVSDPLEDGSANHPFDAIAEAVAAAGSIDTVLLADGLYRGVGNREVDVGTKSLVIRSTGGAAACVIDPEFQGRAFLAQGQTGWARFEGLTIRNGAGASGGGIFLVSSQAVIADCVIENCVAEGSGGGLLVPGFRGRIEGCTLRGNTASVGGGIWADLTTGPYPDFTMSDCAIIGNSSTSTSFFAGGGGMYAFGTLRLERSIFVGNTAANLGGGAQLEATGEVRSCLFAFNGALAGGGALVSSNLRITGSTFAQNFASQRGGGILAQYVGDADWIELESSILWGNGAPVGAQISLDDAAFVGAIHHCDIQGGQAAIEVLPGASLTYGPGNLDVDPVFVAPFHLHPASPCIDAGDPAFSPEPGETDLEGDPRVQGSAIDMGADEAG